MNIEYDIILHLFRNILKVCKNFNLNSITQLSGTGNTHSRTCTVGFPMCTPSDYFIPDHVTMVTHLQTIGYCFLTLMHKPKNLQECINGAKMMLIGINVCFHQKLMK